MNIREEYVEAIIKYGSISRAAKELYISQPYLSQFIKSLEEEVGAELINRQTSPLTLTYAGETYLQYVRKMSQLTKQMKNEMQAISGLKKGQITIGVSPFLATYTLYRLLPSFMKAYPGIEIKLVEDRTEILENLLIDNEIDICLNSLPITNTKIDYDYLYEEYNYIVIPPNHPIQSDKTIESNHLDPGQLTHEKFILAKSGLGLRRFTNQVLNKYNIKPQIILETVSAENAFRLANSGIGITIVPQSVIENAGLLHLNNIYPLIDPEFKSHIVISYLHDKDLNIATTAFIQLAKEMFYK